MSKKTFKKEDIEAAVNNDTDENSPLVLEHTERWIDEGKFQYQENILKETSTGLFYSYGLSKSGSYFTDFIYSFEWEEDEIELVQVTPVTKVIKVWTPVELGEVDIT